MLEATLKPVFKCLKCFVSSLKLCYYAFNVAWLSHSNTRPHDVSSPVSAAICFAGKEIVAKAPRSCPDRKHQDMPSTLGKLFQWMPIEVESNTPIQPLFDMYALVMAFAKSSVLSLCRCKWISTCQPKSENFKNVYPTVVCVFDLTCYSQHDILKLFSGMLLWVVNETLKCWNLVRCCACVHVFLRVGVTTIGRSVPTSTEKTSCIANLTRR